jgi:hypothetical protein
VKIAFTVNGPGEYAGWLRPLLTALYERAPDLDATVFFVPDDFATGREAVVARTEFPGLRAFEPRDYLRFALGGGLADAPARVDRVQYLGGDLMHAARLHRRLGGVATSYKFSRPRYRALFARVFAVDERNREDLLGWKTPSERIEIVGNLAIDGALQEAQKPDGESDRFPEGGILIMPGSRRQEVANLVPFFLRVALRLHEIDPAIPIAFGISPFTTAEELRRALASGGHPLAYGARGEVRERDGAITIVGEGGGHEFPALRAGLHAAERSRVVVTIPGTKTIELAALGVPTVVAVPFNAPEAAVITGPLQYIERVPFVGIPIKRNLALAFARRFKYFAQPNVDADREVMPELAGTLTPGLVARRVHERYVDRAWCTQTTNALREIYAAHRGAAARMASALAA